MAQVRPPKSKMNSLSSSASPAGFHVAMFPWLAMGHITPFVHLSNELAARGNRVTLLIPNKAKLHLQHLIQHPDLVAFSPVAVPHVHGLPEGTEIASEIAMNLNHLLATAMDLARDQVEHFVRSNKPDVIIYDAAHWVPEISRKYGAKTVCYNVVSAASLAIALVPARHVPKDRPITVEELGVPPQGYPSANVVLGGAEAKSLAFITMPFGDGISFYDRTTTAMKECDVLSIRTCRELEGDLCDYMEAQYKKPVILTGPVLGQGLDTNSAKLEDRWAKWLSGFEAGTVVFCAFGTQWILEKDQFQELVLGFELTGLPFLVALKPPVGCATVEEALPDGFEERVKGRGAVVGGWVQQTLILSHPAVGCFVTHCGFGSMWEALMAEAQIVLVPHLGDQILNTKLLVKELKVGVEVEREENGWVWKESLGKAIKSVMAKESDVGVMVMKNHAKWVKTLSAPGFASGYMDRFVDKLKELVLN